MKWTKEQQNVIDFRNRDILVSAAAGSGKTAVLVARIIQRILDPQNPVDIDRLLVVTFTKAAAAEMRERIGAAIEAECEKDPQNTHLRRQSALIHNAMITTIDSFCLFVVRNHFEEISLDPNFRIADEGEIRLLEQDVLEQVFEDNYARQEKTFLSLIDAYAGKRNDHGVREMVAKIYRMSLSSPWPQAWMKKLTEPYQVEHAQELVQTEMLEDIAEHSRLLLCDMCTQMTQALQLCNEPDGPQAYAKTLEADLTQQAENLQGYLQVQTFLNGLVFGKLSPIRKFSGDVQKKETVMEIRSDVKKEVETLQKKYFAMDLETLLLQQKRLCPFLEELVRLALEYTQAMETAKRKKRIVDFADIEHFALRILVDEKTKQPRHTAEEFRRHFAEIMIDEYQDSNQVQEEIMRAISMEPEGGHNLFMVGDVKQSIYRFRLARPELFMDKYASFSTEESLQQRIDLHMNFRSRAQVLDFCNDIFYKIMSPDLGRVAYDRDAALYYGAKNYDENAKGFKPELLLLDEKDELLSETKNLTKGQMEAHMIATRIADMKQHMQVTDKESGQLRPLRYSDIVILLRSLKDYGTDFVQVLQGAGIPAYVESSTGYFSALEVQTVLAMLRILDNPYQDIPMAAVLRSPLVGLDEEEMAQIRVENPECSFAEAAMHAMQDATEGALYDFYRMYRKLREKQDLPIHELIQKILQLSGYGNYAAALPAGERRAANLAMLVEKAVDYEKTSYRGLFHFLRYIDKLQKYEVDFGEADTTGENANVVRVMTIHKSKGLEFKYVFLLNMDKAFNRQDSSSAIILSRTKGIGIKYVADVSVSVEDPYAPNQLRISMDTLPYQQNLAELQLASLSEQMRLLYVAMTRAETKLYLVGKGSQEALDKRQWGKSQQGRLSASLRSQLSNFQDWLYAIQDVFSDENLAYETRFVTDEELTAEEIGRINEPVLFPADDLADNRQSDDILRALDILESVDQLNSQYRSAIELPSVRTPSQIKKFYEPIMDTDGLDIMDERAAFRPQPSFDLPDFGKKAKVTGAQVGSAVHELMQRIPLDSSPSMAVLRSALAQVQADDAVKKQIQLSKIASFFETDLGRLLIENSDRVRREAPFAMLKRDDASSQNFVLRGILDGYLLFEDRIILFDYKTDKYKDSSELIARYRGQLDLYAQALSRSYGISQIEKYLILLGGEQLQVVQVD